MMVTGKWFPQGADLSVPLALRQAVFARGRDSLDDMAQQVVVYREGEPLGAARLWWAQGDFHLGDVGVLPQERHKGYGDLLVRLLLFKALSHNARLLRLKTPRNMAPFFARYGFTPDEAQEERGGLISMCLKGKDIALDGCGGCE